VTFRYKLRWQNLRNSHLLGNVVSLYGIQFAGYAAPLVTIPYLARILGPQHWGLVAFAQAFGLYTGLFVEFGFSLSATRLVAKERSNRDELADIFAQVTGAKAVLAVVSLAIATAVVHFVPQFRDQRILLYAGAGAGIAQAYGVAWFYQGLERMRLISIIDILGRACFAASVFIFVHGPQDDWVVLCLQFFWYSAATLFLIGLFYREFSFRYPSLVGVRSMLKNSGSLFLYRSALTLYTVANTILLGFMAPPASVALYAAGEKVYEAVSSLLTPLSQALYPRMNLLIEHDRQGAGRLLRLSVLLHVSVGFVLAGILYAAAPLIVRIGLGPGYEAVVRIVRVMSALLPMLACTLVMGCHIMLPLGMDKQFTAITVVAGFVNLLGAVILVPRYAHFGMAYAVVITFAFVTVAQFVFLVRRVPQFLLGAVP